ncbi:hypothetical protein [Evtepia gabavorous]|uniref:hypothetical protein n=1 Tax=Evtepia gabavorous TaxID=2211183 RepID=UPI00399983B1
MPAGDNPRYNNCFTLGAKCWEKGKLIKIPVYIDHWDDTIQWLFGSKKGNKRKDYELSYEEARTEYSRFWSSENWETSGKDLRVSLWLDNAMFGNLHIFVIDFDKIDGTVETESAFFKAAKELADKVTRSQGGGYHMFYGVDKQKAEPLFDSINLLASENAASFVCKTGAVTRDGANKVDLFCDTGHFIYEWEEWDNAAGLTDKTQEVYQLIKENFDLSRPMSSGNGKRASGKGGKSYAMLEELSEEELLQQMSTEQREVFANLEKTKSPHWKQNRWLSVGIDIFHVFGADLGGKVFLYWSKPGKTFQPQSCANTWDYICEIAPDSELWDSHWADIMRGTQTGLNRAEEEPSQSAASQVPLPLEEDTSAALEETAAEPTFRDLPIAWENVTTEENGKQRTGHWIVWNGNRSKREEFFKLAFPDQYNKVKKRVKFLGQAADDVLRLTGGQRTKLMYEILAWKYGLEEVSEQDSLDLIRLCQREEDNKTADDLLSRLYWPSGLAKLVTFGVGMKLDAAAQHTWCYSVDYQEDRALFTGSSITWERWQE